MTYEDFTMHNRAKESYLLTQEQVDSLSDNTEVFIQWSGGNGVFTYVLKDYFGKKFAIDKHTGKLVRDPVTFVGREWYNTKVWLTGGSSDSGK